MVCQNLAHLAHHKLSKEKTLCRMLLQQRVFCRLGYFVETKLSDSLLLRLAFGLRAGQLVGLGQKLSERANQIALLGNGGILVAHAEATRSVVVPLSSESEHQRTDLALDAVNLLEDALLGLTVGADTIDKRREIVRRVTFAEIGFRSVFGDVEEFRLNEVAQRIRDALRFSCRTVFVFDLRNVFRGNLSESLAALDVVLEIRDRQDRGLKAHGALRRLGSLTDMTLVRGELRIAVGVARENRSGEGGNEFEVLSAHFVLCFLCWFVLLGCFRFYVEPLTLSHSHQRDRQIE